MTGTISFILNNVGNSCHGMSNKKRTSKYNWYNLTKTSQLCQKF